MIVKIFAFIICAFLAVAAVGGMHMQGTLGPVNGIVAVVFFAAVYLGVAKVVNMWRRRKQRGDDKKLRIVR